MTNYGNLRGSAGREDGRMCLGESDESWRVLSSSEVPGDEETGFLSVTVITTRFTDEQYLPSSLATCKDIESCLCPLSFVVEVTRNLSSSSSFVYNNISSCSGASNLFTF